MSEETLKALEEAVRLHDRKTCRCDCCIVCYMEDTKEKEINEETN